jgi:hypothetical protein
MLADIGLWRGFFLFWDITLSRWLLFRFILRPWRWSRHVPPKRQSTFNGLHEDRTLHNHRCENLNSYIYRRSFIKHIQELWTNHFNCITSLYKILERFVSSSGTRALCTTIEDGEAVDKSYIFMSNACMIEITLNDFCRPGLCCHVKIKVLREKPCL